MPPWPHHSLGCSEPPCRILSCPSYFLMGPILPHILCLLWPLWVTSFSIQVLSESLLNLTSKVQSFELFKLACIGRNFSYCSIFQISVNCILLHICILNCLVSFLKFPPCISDWTWNSESSSSLFLVLDRLLSSTQSRLTFPYFVNYLVTSNM